LAEFRVEPLLADFQRGKALIPSLFATRAGLDVLHHKDTHRKQLAEKGSQAQFPLPACSGRGRQCFLALMPVWPGLTARRFAPAPRAAHLRTLFLRFLDSLPGLGLDIEEGMGSRDDAVALALRSGINAHSDGLDFPR